MKEINVVWLKRDLRLNDHACFAAAEAVAMHIPVISSGKGSLPEVVSGQHIEFSPYTDKGLEAAMKSAMNGKWNKTTGVRKFTLEDSVSEYIKLYTQITSS